MFESFSSVSTATLRLSIEEWFRSLRKIGLGFLVRTKAPICGPIGSVAAALGVETWVVIGHPSAMAIV